MPYSFDFDPANGILRCRLAGVVTDDIVKDFFREGARVAGRTHPAAGVIDLSAVASFEVSAQALREQSKIPPAVSGPGLRRVVIAPSPDVYGMMRMFELEGEEVRPDIHVVRTEQQAWAILGVKNPRFEPLQTE
jgi:hypothetical protein